MAKNVIEVKLYEVLSGKWNCFIGSGHYMWECSFDEAIINMNEHLKRIKKGSVKKSSRKPKAK